MRKVLGLFLYTIKKEIFRKTENAIARMEVHWKRHDKVRRIHKKQFPKDAQLQEECNRINYNAGKHQEEALYKNADSYNRSQKYKCNIFSKVYIYNW